MWTISLPGSLEKTLAENEADPTHVPAARAALEDALAWQLRAVALGMLADRLMQEARNRPGRAVWWHQYTQETAGKLVFWPPDEDDGGFRRFRREIAQQVARRDIVRGPTLEVTGEWTCDAGADEPMPATVAASLPPDTLSAGQTPVELNATLYGGRMQVVLGAGTVQNIEYRFTSPDELSRALGELSRNVESSDIPADQRAQIVDALHWCADMADRPMPASEWRRCSSHTYRGQSRTR